MTHASSSCRRLERNCGESLEMELFTLSGTLPIQFLNALWPPFDDHSTWIQSNLTTTDYFVPLESRWKTRLLYWNNVSASWCCLNSTGSTKLPCSSWRVVYYITCVSMQGITSLAAFHPSSKSTTNLNIKPVPTKFWARQREALFLRNFLTTRDWSIRAWTGMLDQLFYSAFFILKRKCTTQNRNIMHFVQNRLIRVHAILLLHHFLEEFKLFVVPFEFSFKATVLSLLAVLLALFFLLMFHMANAGSFVLFL